jgi:hypothetical protein
MDDRFCHDFCSKTFTRSKRDGASVRTKFSTTEAKSRISFAILCSIDAMSFVFAPASFVVTLIQVVIGCVNF